MSERFSPVPATEIGAQAVTTAPEARKSVNGTDLKPGQEVHFNGVTTSPASQETTPASNKFAGLEAVRAQRDAMTTIRRSMRSGRN